MRWGGGDNNAPLTPAEEGRFKDANTDGLKYTSASNPNGRVTTDGGKFTYQAGEDLTFSIGDLILGTAIGKVIITPIDLVENSHLDTLSVLNIARLLQSLDDDNDLSNGINIKPEVANGLTDTALDFDVAANDFNFGAVITDANSLNTNTDRTYTEISEGNSASHLFNTLRCVYSGGYAGAITDTSDTSMQADFGAIINAGGVIQLIIQDDDDITITDAGDNQINFYKSPFTATFQGTPPTTLTLNNVNNLSGTRDTTRTFTASRVGGSVDAKYRYAAVFEGDESGIFTFDIADDEAITGKAYSVSTGETSNLTGSVIDNADLTAQIEGGGTITATINRRSFTISGGVWNTPNTDETFNRGTFTGNGCTLN